MSQAAKTLRMAAVGCGPIGNLHARAISGSPHAQLVAVCDPDAARRDQAAARWNVRAYATDQEMLAGEALDAVTIATPDHLHVEPTLSALGAGCHVFCEKPLAASAAEAERLVSTAAQRGVYLAVDYNRRFAFGYRTAGELLAAGRIGELKYCVVRASDRTPRAAVARHPQVMLTTFLTHFFDLLRFYGGPIRTVQAICGREPTGELMRSVSLSFQFAGGAVGTIVAGYRDGQTRTAEWLELGGTTGAIVVEDVTRRVSLIEADPDRQQTFAPNHFVGSDAFYDSLVEHVLVFVEHVARGTSPPVTGVDGLAGLKLAAAASESLATGRIIEVPDL